MKDLRLYILMRNDLDSMKAGRAAAQASHASNAFIHKFGKNEEVKEWANQTPQGFGTAIVLSGDVKDIEYALIRTGVCVPSAPHEKVVDPDYAIVVTAEINRLISSCSNIFLVEHLENGMVCIHREEWTCAYIFGEKEQLTEILGKFPLYS